MKRLIDKSESLLLGSTIIFQIVSLFTLLRVATGVAGTSPGSSNTTQIVVVPKSFNESVAVPNTTPQFTNPVGNGLDPSLVLAALFVAANIFVVSILAYLY